MSKYIYWLNGCVGINHIPLADSFGSIIGSEPGDTQLFTQGLDLRVINDATNTVVAKGICLPVRPTTYAAMKEFNTNGPWPLLNSKGILNPEILSAKEVVCIEVGPRAAFQNRFLEFWAGYGYEPIVRTL